MAVVRPDLDPCARCPVVRVEPKAMGPQETLHLVSTSLTQPSDCLTTEGVAEVLTRQGKNPVTGPEV